jgi:transcriptional regulator with XRE-family HTH domain
MLAVDNLDLQNLLLLADSHSMQIRNCIFDRCEGNIIMPIDKKHLGAAIKQVRTSRGVSQAELAKAAGLSGSGNSVALIERGERFVSLDTLNALADALQIPPACLAILGSTHIQGSKEASELMESLKGLITASLLVKAQLRVEKEGEEAKQAYVSNVGSDLSELVASLDKMQEKQVKKTKKASPRSVTRRSAKHIAHS